MIETFSGNLFEQNADLAGVTVNAVGVMGKGVALEAKTRWPSVFKTYQAICRGRTIEAAFDRFPLIIPTQEEQGVSALLIATKRHWRDNSRIKDVSDQILRTRNLIDQRYAEGPAVTICLPPLGCGLGGLDWALVRPLMVEGFKSSRHLFRIPEVQPRL